MSDTASSASPDVARGARWFWWIAGLTAVNLALELAHSDVNFVLGLALTQVAHAMLSGPVPYVVDALLVGAFFLFGRQGQAGQGWAFIVGALLYVVDALVYVKLQAWLPVGFHALALFYIARGFFALGR